MQYLLMLYSDEAGWHRLTLPEQKQWMAAYEAYADALAKAGALRGGSHLASPRTAVTVRVTGGKAQVLDGPFIETKEQLAGYFIIEAPDLDDALAWAARCPAASHGVVEVRAIGTPPSP